MFNLEIENVEKWIRENHPDMAADKSHLLHAAYDVMHSMGQLSHTGMYCQGEPVDWVRDPYRRTFVCTVCGKSENDAHHVFGSEETPEEVIDWAEIEKQVNTAMA